MKNFKFKETKEYTQEEKAIIEKSHKDLFLLAKIFVKNKPKIIKHKQDIYFWNNQHWEIINRDEEVLLNQIYDFFKKNNIGYYWTQKKGKEIEKMVEFNAKKIQKLNDYYNKRNINNGILDIKTQELIAHSSEYYFTYKLDVDFDKNKAEAPHFCYFLNQIMDTDEDIDNIVQLGGYILSSRTIKKMFVFIGEGANGKSLLLRIFKFFIPNECLSSITLNELSNNSFKRAPLIRSEINITTENNSSKSDTDSEEIKKIIDNEEIGHDEKYQKNKSFIPKAKLFLACNKNPFFSDTTYGLYRKLFFIEFKSCFLPKYKYDMEKEPEKNNIYLQKDEKRLIEHFKNEKSAILNIFLRGYKLLEKNNFRLTPTANNKRIEDEYKSETDIKGQYIEDNYELVEEDEEWTDIKIILSKYREWHKENMSERILNCNSNILGKKIKNIFRVQPKKIIKREEGTNRRRFVTAYPIREKIFDEEKEIQEMF